VFEIRRSDLSPAVDRLAYERANSAFMERGRGASETT
jgi:hypothetical protein